MEPVVAAVLIQTMALAEMAIVTKVVVVGMVRW
jgi:hypothetical protein